LTTTPAMMKRKRQSSCRFQFSARKVKHSILTCHKVNF
jgi:hypothetical protein